MGLIQVHALKEGGERLCFEFGRNVGVLNKFVFFLIKVRKHVWTKTKFKVGSMLIYWEPKMSTAEVNPGD